MKTDSTDNLLMRLSFTITFLFAFLLGLTSALSQEIDDPLKEFLDKVPHSENFSSKQVSLIRQEMKLQSIIIEGVEKIRISGGEFTNFANAQSATRDIILQTSLARYAFSDELQKKKFTELVKEVYRNRNLKNSLKEVQDLAVRFVKWQGKMTSTTARTQGLFYAMVKFVSIQFDTTVPFLITASGVVNPANFAIGLGAFTAPISPTVLLPFNAIKSTARNFMLLKRLGWKETLHQFKLNRRIKKMYANGLLDQLNLINVHLNGQQYLLNVHHENVFHWFYKSKKFKQKLNYYSLMKFMEDYPELDDLRLRLDNSRIAKDKKLYTIFAFIESSPNQKIRDDFLQKFSSKIFKKENIDIPSEHRKWFIRTANARSMSKVYEQLAKIPEGIHPQIFDEAWRNFVLPSLAEIIGDEGSIKLQRVFTSLRQDYEKNLRVIFSTGNKHFIDPEMMLDFRNYVFRSMGPIGPCQFIFKIGNPVI